MATRLVEALVEPFEVTVNGQPVMVTHEAVFISGGAGDPFDIQWRSGFVDGLGQFQKVTVRDDPRTGVVGYKLSPLRVQQIMDRTQDGNFDLNTLLTEARLETPFNFNSQTAEGRVARVRPEGGGR